MPEFRFSAPADRNKQAILDHLKSLFAVTQRVLEIGSGTGQHAVFFAAQLPALVWQPTELPAGLGDLAARCAAEAPSNCLSPQALDVRDADWNLGHSDAVFTANTLHIMSWTAVESLYAGLRKVLRPGGYFCAYGPFRYAGEYTAPSNAAFDQSLRARDPASGIRDFEAVDGLARQQGLLLVADHAMPANNQLLVWQRERG